MVFRAGVIGVQGDVSEHLAAVKAAGAAVDLPVEGVPIRRSGVVPECDAIALPGGESTTISRLVHDQGIASELRDHVDAGKPLLATCAGLIAIASDPDDDRVRSLDLLNVQIDRNAFGRQRESFETMLDVVGLAEPFHAVFIRAP